MAELDAMTALRRSDAFTDMITQGMPAPDIISLAQSVARGRYAMAQGQYPQAAAHYRAAFTLEQKLPYQESAYWYYPIQQSVGAALFLAGHHDEASEAFRAALIQAPANVWALYGLARSESAQGHGPEAAAAWQAFRKAWAGDAAWLNMKRL